jgi:hypothetical protein
MITAAGLAPAGATPFVFGACHLFVATKKAAAC